MIRPASIFLFLFILLFAHSMHTQTALPDAVYIFGDSYSDIGEGYVDGNGPTALAYLASDLGIRMTFPSNPVSRGSSLDFAVSAAPTGLAAERTVGTAKLGLGMKNQVRDFATRVRAGQINFSPGSTLFVLAGGLNDGRNSTESSISNLKDEISVLSELGAIHIRIALLPEKIPVFHNVAVRLNPSISRIPAELAGQLPNADIRTIAWGPIFDAIMIDPSRFGITDTTSYCAGREIFGEDPTPCKDVEGHFFYHQYHPSTRVHKIVGDQLYIQLLANGFKNAGHDPIKDVLEPFWLTGRQTEPILPISDGPSQSPKARLLFNPVRIFGATSSDGQTIYQYGRDFVVNKSNGVITIPKGGSIPFRTRDQLELLSDQNGRLFGDSGFAISSDIFSSQGAVYQGFQTTVDYSFSPGAWKGPVPAFGGNQLPRTIALLKTAQDLHILVLGDSISAGYNTSGLLGVPPRQPAYPALVAAALERTYHGRVFLSDIAVSGGQASQGATQVVKTPIVDTRPDLVVVAYGMEDVKDRDASGYGKQIASILRAFKQRSPATEFILVAPMLGNSRWTYTPSDQFGLYRDQLKALCGPGVYLADITTMWLDMLKRKTFFELTGNGLDQPNDFAQRLYAQVIVAALIREEK